MKTPKMLLQLFICLFVLACGSDDDAATPESVCDTNAVTDFQLLVSNTVANNPPGTFVDDVWMDLDTHQYNFEVSAAQTICAIGYQSQGGFTGQYGIEILDVTNNNVLYSNPHNFSATATSYVNLASTVNLVPGVEYAILRTVLNRQDLDDQLGRGLRMPSGLIPFPLTQGVITIKSSAFFGSGGPVNNNVVPYIDLVFEQ
ncbi:MAG: hypothetical protein KKC03_12600 [Bacteroidetes bacterium]|nr:hypothetical protein [Bacteroidota bacterium]